MDHNWQAPKGNMKLDGGYNGSVQQAIANLEIGRNQGRQEGLGEGFEQGREHGYTEGWNAGVARANQKLRPLRDHVREYFTEAVQLRETVAQQQKLIDLMMEQLTKAAQGQVTRAAEGGQGAMVDELASLRSDNQLQRDIVQAVERQYQTMLVQSRLKTAKYKRSLIFTHTAQALLHELVADGSPEALRTRARFAEHYREQWAMSVERGDIQGPPEQDEVFCKYLPETLQFIQQMLQPNAPVEDGSVDPTA